MPEKVRLFFGFFQYFIKSFCVLQGKNLVFYHYKVLIIRGFRIYRPVKTAGYYRGIVYDGEFMMERRFRQVRGPGFRELEQFYVNAVLNEKFMLTLPY